MDFDVAVLGGGLAGLVAAARAAELGARTVLITRGSGSLLWQPGILGPGELRLFPAGDRRRAVAWWRSLTFELGVRYRSGRLVLVGPGGGLTRAIMVPECLAGGNLLSPERAVVVWPDGYRDFPARILLATINRFRAARGLGPWVGSPIELGLRGDETPTAVSRRLADAVSAGFPPAVEAVARAARDCARVGVPALLGRTPQEHRRLRQRWEDAACRPVFEVCTLPPCLPGYRLEHALRQRLRELGVELMEGYPAEVRPSGGHVRVDVLGPGRVRTFRAGAAVLATGQRAASTGEDGIFPCGSSHPLAPRTPGGNAFAVVSAFLAGERAAGARRDVAPPAPGQPDGPHNGSSGHDRAPGGDPERPGGPIASRTGYGVPVVTARWHRPPACYGCQACTAACPAAGTGTGFRGPRAVLSPDPDPGEADRCLGCLRCLTACPAARPADAAPAARRPRPADFLLACMPLLGRLARFGMGLAGDPGRSPLLPGGLAVLSAVAGLDPLPLRTLLVPARAPFEERAPTPPVPDARVRYLRDGAAGGKVVLFGGCYAEHFGPGLLEAARVLVGGHDLRVMKGACCGAPALALGRKAQALAYARALLRRLIPAVAEGYRVVTPCPTCALTIRVKYPLLGLPDAAAVAAATFELGEFLRETLSGGAAASTPRATASSAANCSVNGEYRVAYHQPCHTRAQGLGTPWVQLLRAAGFVVAVPEQSCCGQAGIHGLLRSCAETHRALASDFAALVRTLDVPVVSECPMCLLAVRMAGGRGWHPAVLLAHRLRHTGTR